MDKKKPKRIIEIWECPAENCGAEITKTQVKADRRCSHGHWIRWTDSGPTLGSQPGFPCKGFARLHHLPCLQVSYAPAHDGQLGRFLKNDETVLILREQGEFYLIGYTEAKEPEYVHRYFINVPFWFMKK